MAPRNRDVNCVVRRFASRATHRHTLYRVNPDASWRRDYVLCARVCSRRNTSWSSRARFYRRRKTKTKTDEKSEFLVHGYHRLTDWKQLAFRRDVILRTRFAVSIRPNSSSNGTILFSILTHVPPQKENTNGFRVCRLAAKDNGPNG